MSLLKTLLWSRIPCTPTQLILSNVLQCGQSFVWRKLEDNIWAGVIDARLFVLSQDCTSLMYHTVPASCTGSEGILKDYFQLDIDMEDCYSEWIEKDDNFKLMYTEMKGIRILRQDPVECLFSFICSAANNTERITRMVGNLCQHFGKNLIQFNEINFHSFPTIENLADSKVENKLVSLGFGFRAKYIHQTAKILQQKHSKEWLLSLRTREYDDAVKELLTFPGVGRKVADCICLMSLDKLEAVPVDTHIAQVAQKYYKLKLGNSKSLSQSKYRMISSHFNEIFGAKAGWAQAIIFAYDLKISKERVQKDTPAKRKRENVENVIPKFKKPKLT